MNNLFVLITTSGGCLYRTDTPDWYRRPPVRENYNWHHQVIATVADLKATLRSGSQGTHFVVSDGGRLSFATVRQELKCIISAIKRDDHTGGWRVVGTDDASEHDDPVYDDHTGDLL